MFRAFSRPSSGAQWLQWQPLVLPSYRGDSRAVFVVGPIVTNVLSRGRLRTLPPPHSYGNQRLQRQFDRLLIMGIIMPETCWALSVRQSNKILRLIIASSWVFYLSIICYIFSWYFSKRCVGLIFSDEVFSLYSRFSVPGSVNRYSVFYGLSM